MPAFAYCYYAADYDYAGYDADAATPVTLLFAAVAAFAVIFAATPMFHYIIDYCLFRFHYATLAVYAADIFITSFSSLFHFYFRFSLLSRFLMPPIAIRCHFAASIAIFADITLIFITLSHISLFRQIRQSRLS